MSRLLLLALLVLLAGPATPPRPVKVGAAGRVRIFDGRGGFGPGWIDLGWAPRTVAPGGPASLDFADSGGWIVSNPALQGSFGWLTFRIKATAGVGDALEVRLDSSLSENFPRLRAIAQQHRAREDGFEEIWVSMQDLNPRNAPFDRVVFQAAGKLAHDRVLLDEINLVESGAPEPRFAEHEAGAARPAVVTIDCGAAGRPISPLIYGIGGGDDGWWESGATARRWGGNANTRYNWELGNAWNAGSDWFFRNLSYSAAPGPAWARFIDESKSHGVQAVFTVPTIGWVARDTTSYSFPVSVLGPQRHSASENPDMGDGVAPDGTLLKPLAPSRTSVPAPPEFMARWVAAIRRHDTGHAVRGYILDNEPTLWNSTHRDVHPEPVSYAELLERTLGYGAAVRKADPSAIIAGPAAWGWTALFFSAADARENFSFHLDRLTHGSVPLLPWWLRKVRESEKRTGVRLIDLVDVHFYPQASRIGLGTKGEIGAETNALRIRSTRALWDAEYVDESWIKEPVRLIPRLREWIDENAPGLGISIGEYNFGAEEHMSGGLAVAEALGRFGQQGVTSAYYWTAPPRGSPAFWAFRVFRNFDGRGGRFLDQSVPAHSSDALSSVFASRAGADHLVAVLLNFNPDSALAAEIVLVGCGEPASRRAFSYAGASAGFTALPSQPQAPGHPRQRLAPYSMAVIDLHLKPGAR